MNNLNNNLKKDENSVEENELSIYDDPLGYKIYEAINNEDRKFKYNNKTHQFIIIKNLVEDLIIYSNMSLVKSDNIQNLLEVTLESINGKETFLVTNEKNTSLANERFDHFNEVSWKLHPIAKHIVLSIGSNKKFFSCNNIEYKILSYKIIKEHYNLVDVYNEILRTEKYNKDLIHNYHSEFQDEFKKVNSRTNNNDYFENLNEKSGLYEYGYNVSSTTIPKRRYVLDKIIRGGIYSKYEVIHFFNGISIIKDIKKTHA